MAHNRDFINNSDLDCEEYIAWKKYREDLNERKNFLESYWAHTCPMKMMYIIQAIEQHSQKK